MGRLDGKVALITGAGSGIGRAGALVFSKEGAKVVVADIDDDGGKETVRLIEEVNREATYIHTDVTVVTELRKMIESAVKVYGRLDIFWHNAGIAGPGIIERLTEEAYHQTMNIHLTAGVFGAKFAIQELRKVGGGSILFTGSPGGIKPSPGGFTYSLAKAGLIMLTKCLAVYLGKENIRVNCVAPGPTKTKLWPKFMGRDPDLVSPEAIEKKIMDMMPMRRFTEPEDTAYAALFLVSNEASTVNGVVLATDGGMLAT